MPPDMREALWAVRDRITSVIVQSEEPWIPWELCRLMGKDGDRVIEGPFLCEAFAMTRWLPGEGFKRPLRLTNLALIVPADSGLPLATDERDFVLALATDGRKVTAIDPTFAKVQDAFAAGVYDGWHFTGHGVARDTNPDKSSIILGAEQAFTPEDVSGQAANVGIPHPLVFINACQVGRGGMGLTGIGGWARRFVQSGAGAFIGAYWSVYDTAAFDFAKEVYTRLLDDMPIGDAVREARAKVRAGGDPTWLAYTVFADPLAKVEATPPA
jgi:CHAT domain-containing protein